MRAIFDNRVCLAATLAASFAQPNAELKACRATRLWRSQSNGKVLLTFFTGK